MCFVFICLNSRIILIVWEKSFWNFLLRWQLILFKNYCHFYNIWVDYLVPLQIHLCGSRCSAHLSSTLLWFWEEWAVAYRKPCKTPIHTGAGWRAPRNSSHSLLCSRVPFKISVKKKKNLSIYLLTLSFGSSVLHRFLLKATLFIYRSWGSCFACHWMSLVCSVFINREQQSKGWMQLSAHWFV